MKTTPSTVVVLLAVVVVLLVVMAWLSSPGEEDITRNKAAPAHSGTPNTEAVLDKLPALTEEEKQLYRNSGPTDRSAIVTLNYAREWKKEATQDPLTSEEELAGAENMAQRFEDIVREIRARSQPKQ